MGGTGIYPYYHGQHRWDNYLLDIQDAMEKNSKLLQEQTEELQEQTEELRRQTEQLGHIHDEIKGMREEMKWGLMLIAEKMDEQIDLFADALKKLDEMNKTLKSPLMTQARELFDLGEERLQQRLYDKALEAYLHSEEKNEVNFLLQRRIGMLFLEGVNRECRVIDFAKAEKHLLLAARYAQAAEKIEPNWRYFCAEAYYRAANASYLMSERYLKVGDVDGMCACLERSLEHLSKALLLSPNFTRCLYTQAKCYALLGKDEEALNVFQALSDRNRNYSEIQQDKDLDRIRTHIEAILQSALDMPGPLARSMENKLIKGKEALGWLKRSQLRVTRFEHYLQNVQQRLRTADVDLEALDQGLVRAQGRMERIIEEALQSRSKKTEAEINITVNARREPEQAIQRLQQHINATTGAGIGCLFAVGVFFSVIFGVAILQGVLQQFSNSSAPGSKALEDILTAMGFLVGFPLAIASFFLGKYLSKSRKNRPFQNGIQQQLALIASHNNRISVLSQQLNAARAELQEFMTWRESTRSAVKSTSAG